MDDDILLVALASALDMCACPSVEAWLFAYSMVVLVCRPQACLRGLVSARQSRARGASKREGGVEGVASVGKGG
eukprot:5204195-Alexandrium_andersonii.AAC.1